jgi:hypothetical protein
MNMMHHPAPPAVPPRGSCDSRGASVHIFARTGASSVSVQVSGYGGTAIAVHVQHDEYPVIPVIRIGKQLRFLHKCPYCRAPHWHGAHGCHDPECSCPLHTDYRWGVPCSCAPGTADGHRTPHCWEPASLFRPGGYVLQEVAQ